MKDESDSKWLSSETRVPETSHEKVEAVTGTLKKEREVFESLMAEKPAAIDVIHLVTFFGKVVPVVPDWLNILDCSYRLIQSSLAEFPGNLGERL